MLYELFTQLKQAFCQDAVLVLVMIINEMGLPSNVSTDRSPHLDISTSKLIPACAAMKRFE